ncbi:hypothetical protein [Endozoicomonas lisbonensis]|uniref:Uncharacterized protein n=1 Tax=Endozoicomonas lisbonensis TaxID=3120522 RepID=A0ABV2SJN6_9GAMM
MNDQTVKKLALIIAANCTRESELDESLKQGKLSQEQLNSFNQQMSNKLYTFLTYLLNKPADEYSVMMEALAKHFPENWETPELDQSFMKYSSQNQHSSPVQPH